VEQAQFQPIPKDMEDLEVKSKYWYGTVQYRYLVFYKLDYFHKLDTSYLPIKICFIQVEKICAIFFLQLFLS